MKKSISKAIVEKLPLLTLLAIIAFIFSKCDTFEEDKIPAAVPVEQKNTLTVLSNSPSVVDFSDLLQINGIINVQITKEPVIGTLSQLGEGLYKYTPDVGASGIELIGYRISDQENNFLFSDSLRINIVTDMGDSCYLYAISDNFVLTPDTTIQLDILGNDIICDSVVLSILKQPESGIVSIDEKKLFYTSNGSNEADEFVYKLTHANDPTITSSAIVALSIFNDSCTLKLEYDVFHYNADSTSEYHIDVLANDIICTGSLTATVSQPPVKGSASFNESNQIVYIPNEQSPLIDSLFYEVCQGVECAETIVFIDLFKNQECTSLAANFDYVEFNLDVPGLLIDVLNNDSFCEDSLTTSVTIQPMNGTASFNGAHELSYVPDGNELPYYDSLQYEVCQNGNCVSAGVILYVFDGSCPGLEAKDDYIFMGDTVVTEGYYLIDVLNNDVFCDSIVFNVTGQPANGTAEFQENRIRFTPAGDSIGKQEIIYELCNEKSECDEATVFIN